MHQSASIGAKARIDNPALQPLAFLVGEWRTTGTHPEMAGETLTGRTSFSWHEGGAFLLMRSEVECPEFPDGVAIFGSDDSAGAATMIYFDERGLSRHYDVTLGNRTVTWRRDNQDLSQTVTITAENDGGVLIGKGRMAIAGGPWGDDLSQVFHREDGLHNPPLAWSSGAQR